MDHVVVTERDGPVLTVTINRPDARNAVDKPTADALRQAFLDFDADDSLSVAVLTGAQGNFCAGADLQDPGWLDIFDGLTIPGIARRAMRILDDVIKAI